MGFSQALSGLNSAASALDVLGNNIANSQTVGFKASGTQFADVFANSKVGLGTQVAAVLQDFGEGNLESTERELDLAIAGQGFYRFEKEGEVVYSRNGQLTLTPDGFLENATGARIMGFGLNGQGEVNAGSQPEVLTVDADEMPAQATTGVSTTINLDAREQVGQGTNSIDLDDGAGGTSTVDYHFTSNFSTFDSLGNARNVNVYYEKTGANAWTARLGLDGQALTDGATPPVVQEFDIAFNSSGLLEPNGGDLVNGAMQGVTFPSGTGNGDFFNGEPDDLTFDLDIGGSTQFGNQSTTSDLTQDGFRSGTLVGIDIEADGTIQRNYSNEQSRPAGQIALAFFRNPEGLNPAGDNAWAATNASGQELVGAPGTGVLGTVQSGAIETSNVDMARELVDMIVTQRAYQANSQTIKTQDEVLQAAINLSR